MTPKDPLDARPGTPVFPIVISGPSGVGKTVLIERLLKLEPWLVCSISATSRKPRAYEADGLHYHFKTDDQFEALIAANGFLEWARVHDHYYGTPKAPLEANLSAGRGVVMNIDVQGGLLIQKARPDAVLIFILPPSMAVVEARLRRRASDSEEAIQRRLTNARGEIATSPAYDYLVVNAELEETVERVRDVLRGERHRTGRLLG
ncbi:MAG: guanylate kinase [Candidatus Eisenbacteria bacterium]|nr:guanylate kinase [Candidatus Eisenbacteria bacterium]